MRRIYTLQRDPLLPRRVVLATVGMLLDFTLQERETGGFDVTDVKVMPTFCWRQPDVIQTLPALDYYDAPPAGMTDDLWQRLRDSVDDLRELIGDLPVIGSDGREG